MTVYNGFPLVTSYGYDDENRLTTATYNDSTQPTTSWWRTIFKYDGMGRLRKGVGPIIMTHLGFDADSFGGLTPLDNASAVAS